MRRLVLLTFLIALAVFAAIPSSAQVGATGVCGAAPTAGVYDNNRVAVLIGVNDYVDPRVPDLSGAVNDICLVRRQLISRYGFNPANIVLIADRFATRARILAAIDRELVARSGPATTALIYYSGHGLQVADASGDERSDGLDEAIAPSDVYVTPPILDDELALAFRHVSRRARQLVVFFDSCHSGDANRDVGVARRIGSLNQTQDQSSGSAVDAAPGGLPYIFVSAARSNQSAFEHPIRDRTFGAFTFALASTLSDATPDITYRELVQRVRVRLAAEGQNQAPTIEGRGLEESFLAAESVPPANTAPVWRDDQGNFWIAVGAAEGIRANARFRVGDSEPAILQISELGVFSSRAELVSGALQAGATRAVPLDYAGYQNEVLVAFSDNISSADREAARRYCAEHSGLAIASSGQAFQFQVAMTDDGSFVLRNLTGELMAQGEEISSVLESARRWARWQRLSELRDDGLGPTVSVGLVASPTRPADGAARQSAINVSAGEVFWVTVANASDSALYVGIVELDNHGGINALYPARGASITPLRPGETLARGYRAIVDERGADASQIKVFVSDQPIDLAVLEQEQLRSESASALEQLLADAIANRGGAPAPFGSWMARDLYVMINAGPTP